MKSFFTDFTKRCMLRICLTVNIATLMVCCFAQPVSARDNYPKEITVRVSNTVIEEVLLLIEKQSPYHFLYNSDLKTLQQKVTLNVKSTDVRDILNQLFLSTDLNYTIKDNNLIIISNKVAANDANTNSLAGDDRIITGKVSSEAGVPLGGASIVIKGTNNGVTTNADGSFSINVSDSAVLVISYVGYESQETPVAGKETITITLIARKEDLTQVVVVGYGTQRKIDVTGSTGSVKGSELVKQSVLTATQAIQGKVAGVQITSSGQPGSQPTVRIRGTGSILGGANPLYIVDGVITSDITNINTADIINVDILKDASSTAIYGARGSNGVIIITTKQGTSGKMQINYNGNVGIQRTTNLVQMANAQQYANYISAASYGLITVPVTGISTDWYGSILRNAVEQRHAITLSGATDKTKYYFSAGYEDDQGLVLNNNYKRFTLRANDEFKVSDKVKFGLIATYSNGNNDNVNLSAAYNDAYRAAPIIAGRINGKYGNTSLYQNVGNPILDLNNQSGTTIDNRLEGSSYIEYKPIPSLTLRSSMGADWSNTVNTVYNYAFGADTNTFLIAGGNQSNVNSNLAINSGNSFRWIWDNTATYKQHFNKQDLTILIGTTAEQNTYSWIAGTAQGVPAASNLWYFQNGNQAIPTSPATGFGQKLARNSYLGRVNYSYDNKYLLTINFRADGSSTFPVANRWGYFPSIGAGWILSNENFMQKQHLFNTLKLRASWGKAGNDVTNTGTAGYTSVILGNLPYTFGGTAQAGGIPSLIVDKNLRWETTTESDIAVEFSLLDSKLTGEIAYYNKTADNALIYIPIPATLGSYNSAGNANYVLTNAASIQNQGIELGLNWHDKVGRDFSYTIGANITFNKNNVVGLNGGQAYIDGQVGSGQPYVTKTDVGHPIGSFYVQKVIGIYQTGLQAGQFQYHTNSLGNTDSVYAGSYQPKAYYGINIGLNYKRFDFSLSGYGTMGGVIYNGKKAFRLQSQDNIEASVANSFWSPSNPSNTEPSANVLSQPNVIPASTYFVESGSYFRINNLNIGYTIPAAALKGTKVITMLRIYLSGQNLFTFTKYSGFSPEIQTLVPPTANNSGQPTSSNSTSAGIELNAYPSVKTYSLGVNLGF